MSSNPVFLGLMRGFEPDPRWTVTEWAEKRRMLPSSTAEAGRYKVKRTPYAKEIQDVMSPTSPISDAVCMKGTQLGLTTVADNIAFCYLDIYPRPILYMKMTETQVKESNDRIVVPSLRAMPELAKRIKRGKTKSDLGTTYIKEVPGGTLKFGWAGSSASFRSFTAKVVIGDDIDGFNDFGEGDSMVLLRARTDAVADRKIYLNSTPTLDGHSKIQKEWENSDKRFYNMPCPECSELVIFEWEHFKYESENYIVISDITFCCPNCGSLIPEYKKTKMMEQGEWVATNPKHPTRGYHISSFYSPLGWLSWKEIAQQYLNATKEYDTRGTQDAMMAWTNSKLGLPFKKRFRDNVVLKSRNERVEHNYTTCIPNDIKIITCGADTQDNWFELVTIGYGNRGEMWYLDHIKIQGDTREQKVRDELELFIKNKEYIREDGRIMKIHASAIDTQGHRAKIMYEFLSTKIPDRMFGIKGATKIDAPTVNRTASNITSSNVRTPISVGTHTIKDEIFAKLDIQEAGENFVHIPDTEAFDIPFMKGLVSEAINEDTGRYEPFYRRNEPLDCTVYSIAALSIIEANPALMTEPIIHIGHLAPKVITKDYKDSITSYLDEY